MKMTRWTVAAVIVSLVSPSVALAGNDSLLSSATRVAQDSVRKDPGILKVVTPATSERAALAQDSGFFVNPDRGRRTKMLIGIGVAAAFVGSIWAIAKKSEDVTPSTLGTREDGCCF